MFRNYSYLCFERRFCKQNSVIRLKSNILAPLKFWAGYATVFNMKEQMIVKFVFLDPSFVLHIS